MIVLVTDNSDLKLLVESYAERTGKNYIAVRPERSELMGTLGKDLTLIILDLDAGEWMTDFSIIDWIHKGYNVPVVWATSYQKPEISGLLEKSFPDGILVRPVQLEQLTAVLDLTFKRFRTEIEHRERLEWHKSLIESAEIMIAIHQDGRFVMLNHTALNMLGYDEEEMIGMPVSEILHPDSREEAIDRIQQMIKTGKPAPPNEEKILRKDGSVLHVLISATLITYNGKPAVQVSAIDATSQERASRTTEVLYRVSRAVFDTKDLNEFFAVVHKSLSSIIDVRNFFIALKKPDRNEIYFPYYYDEVDDDYIDIVIDIDNRDSLTAEVARDKKPLLLTEKDLKNRFEQEYSKERGTVSRCWLGVPLLLEDMVIGVMAVQNYREPDIYTPEDVKIFESVSTQIAFAIERKRAAEELASSEEKYRLMVENSRDAIVISQNDKFIYLNQGFADLLGYDRCELENSGYRGIYAEESIEMLKEREQRRKKGGHVPSRYETVFRRKDGTHVDVEANVTVIDYKGEKATFAVIRDITERKRLMRVMEESMAGIKDFEDFLVICSNCAKIRDNSKDGKPWVSPEVYIAEHLADIRFSHGICPACFNELYPEYYSRVNKDCLPEKKKDKK